MADENNDTKVSTTAQDNTEAVKQENSTLISAPETKTDPTKTEQTKTDQKAEDYAFEMPKEIPYDKGILDKFTNQVKELKLPKDQAQKILDIGIENVKQQREQHLKVREGWVNEIKTDKDFGGDKFNETITRAQRVLSDPEIGSPKFVQLLESTGLGDHPEVIKILARIDKKYGEDKAVSGKPSGTTYKSAAELFYPNQNK